MDRRFSGVGFDGIRHCFGVAAERNHHAGGGADVHDPGPDVRVRVLRLLAGSHLDMFSGYQLPDIQKSFMQY